MECWRVCVLYSRCGWDAGEEGDQIREIRRAQRTWEDMARWWRNEAERFRTYTTVEGIIVIQASRNIRHPISMDERAVPTGSELCNVSEMRRKKTPFQSGDNLGIEGESQIVNIFSLGFSSPQDAECYREIQGGIQCTLFCSQHSENRRFTLTHWFKIRYRF